MNQPSQRAVAIGDVVFSNDAPFAIVSGPCQAESMDHAIDIAAAMSAICAERGIGYVFKASFDKANRTSVSGERGLGLDAGLAALQAVKD